MVWRVRRQNSSPQSEMRWSANMRHARIRGTISLVRQEGCKIRPSKRGGHENDMSSGSRHNGYEYAFRGVCGVDDSTFCLVCVRPLFRSQVRSMTMLYICGACHSFKVALRTSCGNSPQTMQNKSQDLSSQVQVLRRFERRTVPRLCSK